MKKKLRILMITVLSALTLVLALTVTPVSAAGVAPDGIYDIKAREFISIDSFKASSLVENHTALTNANNYLVINGGIYKVLDIVLLNDVDLIASVQTIEAFEAANNLDLNGIAAGKEKPVLEANEFEQQVAELTNNERNNHGLPRLQVDTLLGEVAHEKSRDMSVNNYYAHNSPTYGSPFEMMRAYGISYGWAGENIAIGYSTPERVVAAWMNSPGHRKNILNVNFTHIGVGFFEQGNLWTQMFISK